MAAQFQRLYKKALGTEHQCGRCGGPVSEAMTHCPWCGTGRKVHNGESRMPVCCPRCHRGLKADWRYCPWCYGAGFEVGTTRRYKDSHYTARCINPACVEKQLMPFMRYCPWCRRKVSRKWKIEGTSGSCSSCGWGIVPEFWSYCPWCGKPTHSS